MFYKNFIFLIFFLFISNCTKEYVVKKDNIIFKDNFTNRGFTLVYTDKLYEEKIISNKLDERSLIIFQDNLKKNTQVKITNILNNKSLVAKVGKKSDYPFFNNSVISARIAEQIELDIKEPYIEIEAIPEDSLFVAKKAKTFDEEKKVAIKVPVNNISIDNLNNKKKKKKKYTSQKFSYSIKIADFFFNETAVLMVERINSETDIKESNIKKISNGNYRVYLGPYNNIYSLQKSYNDIRILDFENIEIIRND
jgi:hypothetical protein